MLLKTKEEADMTFLLLIAGGVLDFFKHLWSRRSMPWERVVSRHHGRHRSAVAYSKLHQELLELQITQHELTAGSPFHVSALDSVIVFWVRCNIDDARRRLELVQLNVVRRPKVALEHTETVREIIRLTKSCLMSFRYESRQKLSDLSDSTSRFLVAVDEFRQGLASVLDRLTEIGAAMASEDREMVDRLAVALIAQKAMATSDPLNCLRLLIRQLDRLLQLLLIARLSYGIQRSVWNEEDLSYEQARIGIHNFGGAILDQVDQQLPCVAVEYLPGSISLVAGGTEKLNIALVKLTERTRKMTPVQLTEEPFNDQVFNGLATNLFLVSSHLVRLLTAKNGLK
ncbi:hypothetical protein KKE28_03500 [Patescibacteria group bacterium]|nr:hypothetical protein [Patescibacteria group bacterium]MBU1915737.1 hypothetical protein [Patescibacteria group bacterium]